MRRFEHFGIFIYIGNVDYYIKYIYVKEMIDNKYFDIVIIQ